MKNVLLLYRNNRFDRCTTSLGQYHCVETHFDTKREFRGRHDEKPKKSMHGNPTVKIIMHPEWNTRGSKEIFHCKAVGLSSRSDGKFKLTMLLRTTGTRWITRCKYEVMINGIIIDNP
jgi:hypothetical protein